MQRCGPGQGYHRQLEGPITGSPRQNLGKSPFLTIVSEAGGHSCCKVTREALGMDRQVSVLSPRGLPPGVDGRFSCHERLLPLSLPCPSAQAVLTMPSGFSKSRPPCPLTTEVWLPLSNPPPLSLHLTQTFPPNQAVNLLPCPVALTTTTLWSSASHKDWDFLGLPVHLRPGSGLTRCTKRSAGWTVAWRVDSD